MFEVQWKAGDVTWLPFDQVLSQSVIAYETREKVGGIWLPSPPVVDDYNAPVTALYDSLTTNVPHPIMAYTSYSFPPETPLFPSAHVVQTYLESYAAYFNLMPLIKFDTAVLDARWESTQWIVTLSDGGHFAYDHLIVTNGHYHLPRIPELPGLADWMKRGRASHSAWYRKPDFLGDKILVVGGGPSGEHIATEIDPENLIRRGRLIELKANGQALFDDGTTEDNIDYCILATGFCMHFPFLEEASMIINNIPPDFPPLLPGKLFNSTYHVFPLAKRLFPLQSPYPISSIAFMGLLIKVVPFPLMEAQAYAIVRTFSDPSSLDPIAETVDIITHSDKIKRAGASTPLAVAKAWIRFDGQDQWDYRNAMYQFAQGMGSGTPLIKVTEWEKELYGLKVDLRSGWEDLEKSGDSIAWLRDVGKNGVQDWVELMYRVLDYARTPKDSLGKL
ncbi:FAD/NAD(P)-binding domain-containing protein [Suillus plorans]|uniref:FAD/NAD(P)-binding domain-containing protein n=1 Tax=Suillus plorans TaxID=116603 RepID=A0A9P7DSX5_9AGAM|nr:FAD/NAD(P)-binding domain-containing protein [Suillus plorans]KAG1802280.1 FAD/NAD(P)-binding domain-containing protein [Suillus plorans]